MSWPTAPRRARSRRNAWVGCLTRRWLWPKRAVTTTFGSHHRLEGWMTDAPPFLEMRGIVKRFPGVLALNGVSWDVRPGEVHVLLGENGAGKSTLTRTIAGVYRPDAGEIRIDGQPVRIRN